ncbi:MAG: hypothetical protein M1821_008163 [Bathelium mastoideum]|nr:MAG: hypothetical protein M1821_008163 [Bathelium mastoideum]
MQIPPPPSSDITAYTSIFSPTTSTSKALVAFAANAKKGSLRATIASHMQTHFLPPNTSTSTTPSLSLPNKIKTPDPPNPYLDFWTWTCHNLEWAGPTPQTVHTHHSHPLLPILYHHFGCICPTHDALVLIRQLCQTTGSSSSRSVLEIGSGGGYWAYLLRQLGVTVTAVDNGVSEWRTRWIGDTVAADGVSYLQRNRGGRDAVLLLVYPQVGGDFTGKMLQAYAGDAVVVAGTQNANGFTGFKGETVAEWMEREMGKEGWKRAVQVPLPSFAGKDEALFVFVRDEKKGS